MWGEKRIVKEHNLATWFSFACVGRWINFIAIVAVTPVTSGQVDTDLTACVRHLTFINVCRWINTGSRDYHTEDNSYTREGLCHFSVLFMKLLVFEIGVFLHTGPLKHTLFFYLHRFYCHSSVCIQRGKSSSSQSSYHCIDASSRCLL